MTDLGYELDKLDKYCDKWSIEKPVRFKLKVVKSTYSHYKHTNYIKVYLKDDSAFIGEIVSRVTKNRMSVAKNTYGCVITHGRYADTDALDLQKEMHEKAKEIGLLGLIEKYPFSFENKYGKVIEY